MATKQVCTVNSQLASLLVPISGLVPDPKNARLHSERNIKAIADSIARFGQQKPIVLAHDGSHVIAGSGTLAAAKQLGWTHIAAVRFDSKEGKLQRGFKIADNRSAELAEWDWPILADELRALRDEGTDLGTLGFDEAEAGNLLKGTFDAGPLGTLGGEEHEAHTVRFTAEQWGLIGRACERLRRPGDKRTTADLLVAVAELSLRVEIA